MSNYPTVYLHIGDKFLPKSFAAVPHMGQIIDTGQFVPGEPYVFATDPDGYTIEIWYEPDT